MAQAPLRHPERTRRLVLVRHSMPEIERDRPASSWRLGETGRRRSELLADRLRSLGPEVVWSSREPKAVETANVVADRLGVPVRTVDGLEEHHRGGVPYFPTREEFEEAIGQFFNRPDQLVLGTETAAQSLNRFTAAVDRVVGQGHTESIVVTHGTVMTLYVASVAGVRPTCLWRRLGVPSYVVLTLPSMQIESTVERVIEKDAPSHDGRASSDVRLYAAEEEG